MEIKKLLVSILLLFLFISCNKNNNKLNLSKPNNIVFSVNSEPNNINPQSLMDTSGVQIDSLLFEGLIKLNKNKTILPAGAVTWKKKGLKYIFYLRKDAKWSNGDSVIAQNYLDGWKKGLSPKTISIFTNIMYSIKGAQNYHEEKTYDFSNVGIKVINDYTLEVTLKKETPNFLELLSLPFFAPIHKVNSQNLISNGRYTISKWLEGDKLELIKNKNYWNKNKVKIDKFIIPIISNKNRYESVRLNMYKNNQLDIVEISKKQLNIYNNNSELVIFKDPSNSLNNHYFLIKDNNYNISFNYKYLYLIFND